MSASEADKDKAGWKQRAVHELIEYWINFVYLACFFGAFTWYRRLTLAEYHISYLHYGTAVIEALILAKVILIGDMMHLGRGFTGKPLIFPTLYKAAVFTLFVAAFQLVEETVVGLLRGKGLAGGVEEIRKRGIYALLARCLVIFFAFIPFFAFKELGRILGDGKIIRLFFRNNSAMDSGSISGAGPTLESPAH